MRTTNDGAQLAMDVAETLDRRPPPDDAAWIDEVLVGWWRLPSGRSAIARALAELWERQWPRQIEKARRENRHSGGMGFTPADLLRQADSIAEDPRFIREQDIIAALNSWAPNALRDQGLDSVRFLSRVRELEGPAANENAAAQPTNATGEALAESLLVRLESDEPLSALLLPARRYAEIERLDSDAAWLLFETVGPHSYPRMGKLAGPADRAGVVRYLTLHKALNPTGVTADNLEQILEQEIPRNGILAQSIREIERLPTTVPPIPDGMSEAVNNRWLHNRLTEGEGPRILALVRAEVHRFISESLSSTRERRLRRELLGEDAEMVLEACGSVGDELRNAIESLQRPKGQADAAGQARVFILTLGRELYRGPREHKSPINGTTFAIVNEKYMLRAYVDGLWVTAPLDRKTLLEAAHGQIEETYEIGSRAKNPYAVSSEEARHAVRCAFGAARAIVLTNGLPLQTAVKAEATPPESR